MVSVKCNQLVFNNFLTESGKNLKANFETITLTGKDNTVFESTINGASVSGLRRAMPSMWRSPIIMTKKLQPIHPGEILNEEFLKPLKISQSKLARDIHVPHRRVNEIVLGKRSLTPDTALRLSRYLGSSAEFWLNLQSTYELRLLERKGKGDYAAIPRVSNAT